MNEFQLINFLTESFDKEQDELITGIGDDCAVISNGDHDLIVSTDAFSEGVHFDFSITDEFSVGFRICNATISDIAAMGGEPLYLLISIGIPKLFNLSRIKNIYDGIAFAAGQFDTLIIGGDTVSNHSNLFLSLTIIGKTRRGKSILRSGAKPGDTIYLTGNIGKSALGLECLKKGRISVSTQKFISAYQQPTARVNAGLWLSGSGVVTSMIDISDGLLADIGHICDSSEVGYEIMLKNIFRDPDFDEIAKSLELDPNSVLLGGGDDYELVFTVANDRVEQFDKLLSTADLPFNHSVVKIGRITENPKSRVVLDEKGAIIRTSYSGYNHLGDFS